MTQQQQRWKNRLSNQNTSAAVRLTGLSKSNKLEQQNYLRRSCDVSSAVSSIVCNVPLKPLSEFRDGSNPFRKAGTPSSSHSKERQ